MGDEPPGSIRDTAPDVLAPIDASAPVSGHVARHRSRTAPSPRRPSTTGRPPRPSSTRPSVPSAPTACKVSEIDAEALAAEANRSHSQPLVDEGPCDIPVVYALNAGAFDVIVNGDHLLSWGVGPEDIQDAAMRNLATWSASAAWTDEVSGERRLLSSDTGDGWDAARILLPEVIDKLTTELGPVGRVLVGLPERHLLVAGTLRPGDDEFAGALRRLRRRALRRRRRADRPAGLRAGRRPPRRVRGHPNAGLMPDLRVDVADAIATFTLDRPDALNSLTVPLKDELLKAFRGVGEGPAPSGS